MIKLIFSCFNQFPSNFTCILVPLKSILGPRLLSDIAGGLTVSSDKPLEFHAITLLLVSTDLAEILNNFLIHHQ